MLPDLHDYRWIVFDAVGTLIAPSPSVSEAYHAVAVRYGSRLTPGEIGRRFGRAFRESELKDDGFVTSETIERDRWWFLVSTVLDDVSDPAACFEDLCAHFARPQAWRCFPDVAATGLRLQSEGHRLAIASNFDGRLHQLCAGLPELAPFPRRITSAELGFRKPSPRFYVELVRALRCRPKDVLMIGDDPHNDVAAAREAGVPALLLDRGPNPAGDLTSLKDLILFR